MIVLTLNAMWRESQQSITIHANDFFSDLSQRVPSLDIMVDGIGTYPYFTFVADDIDTIIEEIVICNRRQITKSDKFVSPQNSDQSLMTVSTIRPSATKTTPVKAMAIVMDEKRKEMDQQLTMSSDSQQFHQSQQLVVINEEIKSQCLEVNAFIDKDQVRALARTHACAHISMTGGKSSVKYIPMS